MPTTQAASPLTLRTLCAGDLDRIFSARSRPFGEEWLARQARGEAHVAVAELDGAPVGRVVLDFQARAAASAAFLFAAHVEPGFQSRGIGTALFLHLEQVALQHGFQVIELYVDKENVRAQRLYERLGYAVCGEAINRWSYHEDGRVVEVADDCWVLRKCLAT